MAVRALGRLTWALKSSIQRRIFPLLSQNVSCEGGMSEAEVKHIILNPVPGIEFEIKEEEIRKRTYALLLSFYGQGFHGMQVNPETDNGIENYLLDALLSLNLITEEEAKYPQLFHYQRASRTDKNVSAARMLVSGEFPEVTDMKSLKQEINKHLNDQIRVMAVFRVTKTFNSKLWCDARSYSYLCPTFAFAPITKLANKDYRMCSEVLEQLKALLSLYEGSHNFHNFTSKVPSHEHRAQRVIFSVDCGQPFERYGWEWINIKLRGQSFLLHQIRKMLAVVMAASRGLAHPHFMPRAMSREYVDLLKAPALGLVLENQHFDFYNRRYGDDGFHQPLKWDEAEEEIQKFCEENIYNSIMKKEMQENSMLRWMACQYFHNYQTNTLKEQAKMTQDRNHRQYLRWRDLCQGELAVTGNEQLPPQDNHTL